MIAFLLALASLALAVLALWQTIKFERTQRTLEAQLDELDRVLREPQLHGIEEKRKFADLLRRVLRENVGGIASYIRGLLS